MIDALHRNGAPLPNPYDFIKCVRCDQPVTGALTGSYDNVLSIEMCANRLKSNDHFETVLTHELIHAYDHWTNEINPNNLLHMACSEIRAANLSGDCTFTRAWKTGLIDGIMDQHDKCVQKRATMSIVSMPECESPEQAKQVVQDAFPICIKNLEPFGAVPWQ